MEKKYPIGGYAPGNYHNRCGTCNRSFFGDKRAFQCEPCALEAKARFDALPLEEQMQLVKRNGQIAQVMIECPVSPERDLILRIVEQWGNVIQMPNMEQWLKDYAAKKTPASAVWVKASMRLPKPEIGKEVIFINRTHNASLIWEFTSDLGPSLNIHLDGWSLDQWEWLDESATPAAPAGHDNALYETRLALRDMVKLAKHIGCKIAEYNQYSQRVEAAEAMLQKHSKVTDMLRAPAAGREENMSEAQFLFFNNWLSEGGYSYDGEYYYNEANDFFTPAQLYQLFKEQNK